MNNMVKWFELKLLWVGLALLFAGSFVKLTLELHEDGEVESLDRKILMLISDLRIPVLNGPAVDMTALGSPTVLTLITVFGTGFFVLSGDRRRGLYLVLGGAGAGLATFVIKHLFTRPRPDVIPRLIEVTGFSYPSGHTLGATSIYLLLMMLVWHYFQSTAARWVLAFATGFIVASVSFSRLYLGVHYPSDVASGMMLGAAWTCLLTYYFLRSSPAGQV